MDVPVADDDVHRVIRTRRVTALRAENDKSAASGALFTRACRDCHEPHPTERFIRTRCGHAICRACSELILAPLCKECAAVTGIYGGPSPIVRLYEEKTESAQDEAPVLDTSVAREATFSRACGVCYAPNPAARSVIHCGHVVCQACAEQVKRGETIRCPFCRVLAPVVRLREALIWLIDGSEQGEWELPPLINFSQEKLNVEMTVREYEAFRRNVRPVRYADRSYSFSDPSGSMHSGDENDVRSDLDEDRSYTSSVTSMYAVADFGEESDLATTARSISSESIDVDEEESDLATTARSSFSSDDSIYADEIFRQA